jgi:hypothetical protein
VTVDLRCERVVNLCDRLASFCDDERSRRERMLAGGDGGKEAEAATLLFTSLGEGELSVLEGQPWPASLGGVTGRATPENCPIADILKSSARKSAKSFSACLISYRPSLLKVYCNGDPRCYLSKRVISLLEEG